MPTKRGQYRSNWDLIEYPKELGIKKVISLSKDQEQALIQCIYMDLNRKTAGILIALFTGVRIGELCGLQMKDISLADKTININKTVQRIYDKEGSVLSAHRTAQNQNISSDNSCSVSAHEHHQEVLYGKSQPLLLDRENKADRASHIPSILFPFSETERSGKGEIS